MVFRDWSPYAVAVIGALTIAITQLAYRAGPLAASLPALTISDPVAAVALGILALGERLDDRPAPLALAATALAVMIAAAAALARRSAAATAGSGRPLTSRVGVRGRRCRRPRGGWVSWCQPVRMPTP
jgi:hypothetical protein